MPGIRMRGTRCVRYALLAYVFVGCDFWDFWSATLVPNSSSSSSQGGCGGGGASGSSQGGCEPASSSNGCQFGASVPNGTLRQGDFTYVCPSAFGRDPWCDFHAAIAAPSQADASEASDAGSFDAAGVAQQEGALVDLADGGTGLLGSLFTSSLPDVVVGSPFQLAYEPVSPAPGLGAPAVALAALATETPPGVELDTTGWAGFVVQQSAAIFDYTHIRARPVESLSLWVTPPPGPSPLALSTAVSIEALPLSTDGTLLAGPIHCEFRSSNPAVATISSSGPVASFVPHDAGPVTVTATCAGTTAQVTFSFGSSARGGEVEGAAADAQDAAPLGSDATLDGMGLPQESGSEHAVGAGPADEAGEGD